jgi:pimeloyl-ACP methyl ester carboxylesterase
VQNGTIRRQAETIGGHAFAIVGYNSKGFLVQNSWGRRWGTNGVALWSYEDWQDNIRDAWVFRLALPTPQIWHKPPNSYAARLDDMEQIGRSPSRAEIAGHFVHLDDGRLHGYGRYWSSLSDIQQTAELVAESNKYDHLLIYAHGGLNSVTDSARRISAMKAVFKANRIYPFHVMYDTGLMEELKDVVLGRKQETEARAGGFADWFDRLLERLTRKPGRALWREMKFGARSPFAPGADGEAVLRAFRAAFVASGKWKKFHLVGHSTGGILMAYLLDALEALGPTHRVSSCSLMAPAGTLELFRSHYKPLLDPATPFGIDQMTVYNLSDALEQDDNVAQVYRKSLLYLVSHAFEEQAEAPLLGMQKHNAGLVDQVAPGTLEFVYSDGAPGRTAARSHGGFDNDPHTMNDILRRVLGAEPTRPFTAADLDY